MYYYSISIISDEAVRLTYEQCHKVKEKEEKIGTRSPISGGSSPLTSERSSSLRHTEYAGIFEDAILYMREKGDVPSEDEDLANYGEEERGGDNWGGDQDEWGGIEGGGFEERSFDVSEDGVDSDRGEGRRCEEDISREEGTGEERVLNEEEQNSDRGDEDKTIARDEGEGGGGVSEEVEGVTTEKKTKRRLSDIEDGEVSDSSDDEVNTVEIYFLPMFNSVAKSSLYSLFPCRLRWLPKSKEAFQAVKMKRCHIAMRPLDFLHTCRVWNRAKRFRDSTTSWLYQVPTGETMYTHNFIIIFYYAFGFI